MTGLVISRNTVASTGSAISPMSSKWVTDSLTPAVFSIREYRWQAQSPKEEKPARSVVAHKEARSGLLWLHGLRQVLALGPALLVPAHGPQPRGSARAPISATRGAPIPSQPEFQRHLFR